MHNLVQNRQNRPCLRPAVALSLAALTLCVVAPFLHAEEPSEEAHVIHTAMRDLRSRDEPKRLVALELLAATKADLTGALSKALSSKNPAEVKAGLSVIEARSDYQHLAKYSELLSNEDTSLSSAAQRALRAGGVTVLTRVHSEMNGAADEAVTRLAYESYYAVGRRLADAAALPGYFGGDFEKVFKNLAWASRSLIGIAALAPGVEQPLVEALADFREQSDVSEDRSYVKHVMAGYGDLLPLVVARLREGGHGELVAAREAIYAASLLSELRVRAVQAAATVGYTDAGVLAALEKAYNAEQSRPLSALMASRDQDALVLELELTMFELGQTTLLDTRLVRLLSDPTPRADAETPRGLAEINADAVSEAEIQIDALNRVAYIMLRTNRASEAVKLYQQALKQAEANIGGVNVSMAAIAYNLACAQSLAGNTSDALATLKSAVTQGYREWGWILKDADLAKLRESDAFVLWYADSAPPYFARKMRESAE